VGGPYEYGVPGSVHAVLAGGDREKVAVGGNGHAAAAENGHANGNGHGNGAKQE